MKFSVLICSVLITITGFYVEDSLQVPSRCREVKILNGRMRQKPRGRMVRFYCDPGFKLIGNKYAICIKERLDLTPPICVKTTCSPIEKPENSLMVQKESGAVLMFFCEPGYQLQGPKEIYCTGTAWNDTAPTCKNTRTNPPTSCNFDDPDLCSWEQDPMHDFDWTRHNFRTGRSKIPTGPSHDHTLGSGYNGYYLYTEASGRTENHTARIVSPLYSSNLTEAGCFSFWYHMYGRTIGTLNVFVKAEGETKLGKLMFTKSGNQGNAWWPGFFYLPKVEDNFQIIIEGVRGQGYLSDIAIDDVAILQGNACMDQLNMTKEVTPADDDNDQVEIVNSMQTCNGKCTNFNATLDSSEVCQCDLFCMDRQNCCPDYDEFCFSSTDFDDISTSITEGLQTFSFAPIPISPKDGLDPNPPKWLDDKTSEKPTPSSTQHTLAVTVSSEEVDAQKSSRDPRKFSLSGIIAIVAGIAVVMIVGAGLVIFSVLQVRNNYKKNSRKSALSEDSDVRFLTSDEMLDFNIAKPEDMELPS
ncbi:MAM and LDL-receptor class A domain-containing protein 2-like [Neodiprion virginianus]|uniref:MAM and LDL-receptor class A domain-containing protein 2-like n=1 Tax=Neodiprion virginianus TaxID=2961670 RepID=UPI001EE6E572|nr:MAM and LDL-receptor class A domain-containing protein 2-like [Neodiprion virginianus]